MHRRNRPPSRLNRQIRRFVGGSLAAVILAQAGLADAAVSCVWGDRHRADAPSPIVAALPLSSALKPRSEADGARAYSSLISPSVGTIRVPETRTGSRKGSLLLIQDVHLNLEAQKNISGAIESLAAGHAVDLIAVEGSSRALPIAAFREAPDAESLRMASDFLLEKGQISGAVRAALVAPMGPRVEGIDDDALHAENADAYRAAGADLSRFRAAISSEQRRIAREKETAFGPDLAAFDAKVAAHRRDGMSFGDYVGALSTEATRRSVPVSADLSDFVEAAAIEKSIDLNRVETERAAVLSRLSEKLSTADATELLRAGIAFRSRDISHADFYRAFAGFCGKAGIKTGETPELQKYLRYLSLADGIDGAKTLAAADSLELDLYRRLSRTESERALIDADRTAFLARKLSTFSMTRAEWDVWSRSPHHFSGADSFERFYTAAERRDRALADNLLSRMGDGRADSAVAVVGGFHAASLARRLSAAGYDVALLTPALTRVDGDGSAYLTVFSREKTPLEKLFDGQKLFLAADPLSDASAVSLADLVSSRALLLRRAGDYAAWFQRTLGLVLRDRRVQRGTVRHIFVGPDGHDRAVDVDGVSADGFTGLPRASRPTGTFAVGRTLFSPFTTRWVELTLRLAPILELPHIYVSAFSARFRNYFLTPSWNLADKRDALKSIHGWMAIAAGAGAVAGYLGFVFFGSAPSLTSALVSGAAWTLTAAFAASVVPALWLHDLANKNPRTRLTEGDPGGYAERLRVYLAGLTGAPDSIDTAATEFQFIASETKNLLRNTEARDAVFVAWRAALEGYRAPFEDLLVAVFRGWTRIDPHHVIPPVEEFVTELARHHDRSATGPLIDFVINAFSAAVAATLRAKQDEMWARDSEPLRILEVTPEVRPFRMSGGMAVVNGELPNELNRFHAWATTVSLYYDDGKYDLDGVDSPFTRKEKMPFELRINIAGELHVADVYRIRRRNDDGTYANFYFLKDTFPEAGNLSKKLYPTERALQQAVFLSEGALQLMKELHKTGGKRFDILRAHDWVAGLAAIYVKTRAYAEDPEMRDALKGVHPMAFLHNLEPGYKGRFLMRDWHLLGLDDLHKQAFGWTSVTSGPHFSHILHGFDEAHMSIVKALSHHVEGMFVPAPTYAHIIQTPTYGYEMAEMFRARAHILTGILNGTEYDAKDELLYPKGRRPVADFLAHQARAKLLLLKESGLYSKIEAEVRDRLMARDGRVDAGAFDHEMAIEIDRPILGAVLRLDPKMKGVWFFRSVGERLTHKDTPRPIRVILLGSPLTGQAESEEFVRQMKALSEARPTRVAFFPTGRLPISKAGLPEAERLRLGRRIQSLNDLIQAATIGFYPSKVEPGGLADVESMERGAFVIVSDKGGFADKGRDFDDTSIVDREPTGAVFKGDYTDHEAMIRLVERVVNLYYDDRARFNQISASNKNLRFTMARMARAHVVAMAKLIGRNDIAETPEKPVHRTSPAATAVDRSDTEPRSNAADDIETTPTVPFVFAELRHALSPNPSVYEPALAQLEGRLYNDDEAVRSEALKTLATVARLDNTRISPHTVTAVSILLFYQKLSYADLPEAATILINGRQHATRTTIEGIEKTVSTIFLSRRNINILLDALMLIGHWNPDLLAPSTLTALETAIRSEGHRPITYREISTAMSVVARERPDLLITNSVTGHVLAQPESLRRHSWSHYDFAAINPFPDSLSLVDRYTIGVIADRLLQRLKLPITKPNAEAAVNAVVRRRAERGTTVVLGPDYNVITMTHAEARFKNETLEAMARNAGVQPSRISVPHKGPASKKDILNDVITSRGPLGLLFDGHGSPNHLWLESAHDDTSTDLFTANGISYVELGDALLESAKRQSGDVSDLSHVSLILNTCYSYNFSEKLMQYLTSVGVIRTPIIVAAGNRHREVFGPITQELFGKTPRAPLTMNDVFATETDAFAHYDFTDLAIFDSADGWKPENLPSSQRLGYLELGLASPTTAILRLLGLRSAKATAAVGAILESLFILAAIPAFFFAVGVPAGSLLLGAQLAIFPAIHLLGAITPVRNADGTVSLRRDRPSAGRLLRLFVLGIVLHALLPAGVGIAAHMALNLFLVSLAKPETVEARLAKEVAAAARERLSEGAAGAAWQTAMKALVQGRAARVGVDQFGGSGAGLSDIDGEHFDAAAFRRALESALIAEKMRGSASRSAAYDTARDVAFAGLSTDSLDASVARMNRAETNFIIAESLSDDALPVLAARLRSDPDIRATLILKSGSERSAAVARALGSLSNLTMETSDDIVSADGSRIRVSMSRLDGLLALRGFSGGRVHVWAGKDVEFDTAGLARNSALREALYTILDALSITASFQRMDLLDTMYRLMASQA